jgi:hypothetical protein
MKQLPEESYAYCAYNARFGRIRWEERYVRNTRHRRVARKGEDDR